MMTTIALTHALKNVTVPSGRALWIYGDPMLAKGDVYSPWYDAAYKHIADIQILAPHYDAVIVNSSKQQDEAEGLLALAMQRSNGFVMAVAPKNAGGGRLEDMMEEYGVVFDALSKDGCRVVWTFDAAKAKQNVIAQNIANLDFRQITVGDETWWTVPGVFGWNKIDVGSRLLLEHLPDDLKGNVADFGCGYGYLAAHLSRRYPAIKKIDAYDADARAVAATKRNCDEKVRAEWLDIRALHKHQYDAVVMNPPFHHGKNEDHSLGEDFILTAWKNLKSGGRLFFVANQHLPYDKIIPGLVSLHQGDGFKIITGVKS